MGAGYVSLIRSHAEGPAIYRMREHTFLKLGVLNGSNLMQLGFRRNHAAAGGEGLGKRAGRRPAAPGPEQQPLGVPAELRLLLPSWGPAPTLFKSRTQQATKPFSFFAQSMM